MPTFQWKVVVKDSQSNPNRARLRSQRILIVQTRSNLMLVASTPEQRTRFSTQCEIEEGYLCISTVAPWRNLGSSAPPGRFRLGGPPAAWKNFKLHLITSSGGSKTFYRGLYEHGGPRGADQQISFGGLFPNEGDGNAWGDKKVRNSRRVAGRRKAGYKAHRPRPRYQKISPTTFSATDQRVQGSRQRRDHHRGRIGAPDFTTILETGAAARLQGRRSPSIGQGDLCSRWPVEALGKDGQQTFRRRCWWSAEPSVQIRHSTGMKCERTRRQL